MTDKQLVSTYLQSVRDTHATGATGPETSYYPAIKTLLNAVGDKLKPRVKCEMNLRNSGNGMPDGGLFTADQISRRTPQAAIAAGNLPARGAAEVKGAKASLDQLAASEQIARFGYLTNLSPSVP